MGEPSSASAMPSALLGGASYLRPAPLADVPPAIRALWVDGESLLPPAHSEFLAQHGVELVRVTDTARAVSLLSSEAFDIVLLGLPHLGSEGLTLAQRLRASGRAPLILAGRGSDEDKILGLEAAADDYLATPLNPRELLARMRAVLRRSRGVLPSGNSGFASKGLVIRFDAREVTVDGVPQKLTAREYALLCALAQRAGKVLTRDQLLELLRGRGATDETFGRSIDVHMSRLRTKIERDPRHPRHLKTVRGIGYLVTREG